MKQQTLADGSVEKFRKKTRKEQFQDEIKAIIPWQQLNKNAHHLFVSCALANLVLAKLEPSAFSLKTGMYHNCHYLPVMW